MKLWRMIKNSGVIEAVLLAALAFALCYTNLMNSFDSLIKDNIYQLPRGINNKIKIIAIDNKTIQALGPFGTWSRQVYADVLDKLGEYPAVVAFDIMFFGEMTQEGDDAFYNACKIRDNVVVGSYIDFKTEVVSDNDGNLYVDKMYIKNIEMPFVEDVCRVGYFNSSADEDGIVRSSLPVVAVPYYNDGQRYNSFALETYNAYCEHTGIPANPTVTDSGGKMWINYAGKPYDYEYISLIDVLNGEANANPKIFTDCMVLVGAYASGLQDQFSVPNSSDQMYGVEIHANIIQGMLDGKMPVPADRIYISVISALLSAAAVLVFKRLRIRLATILLAIFVAGYIFVGIMLNSNGMIIPVIYVPLVFIVAYIITLVMSYLSEIIEKAEITKAFKKYVAPQVVEEIAKTGQFKLKLGGENRHIAVLFVDIRGFTPMSESLEPEQVVDILNTYLNLTTNAIFNNSGTLDKFIGDATMAIFNAPFDLDDYVFKAVKTAWDIVQGGNEIESKFLEKYGKSVGFGVGVNCGNAVVGNIGCDFRMDYTAIGDTVNTAARLEANAKRGNVLLSAEVYEQVKDRITVEEVGEIPLKGKSKGVFVYSLVGINGEAASDEKITEKEIKV